MTTQPDDPKSVEKLEGQTVYLAQRHYHLITEWQDTIPTDSFSAALRMILDLFAAGERDT